MIGKSISFYVNKTTAKLGEEVLNISNLKIKNIEDRDIINDVSFKIREGEIVGIAGVAGNGQVELVEAISGLRKIFQGSIKLLGEDITADSIKKRRSKGIAFIPEDRQNVGLALDASVSDNLLMGSQKSEEISKKGFLFSKKIQEFSKNLINKYTIKVSNQFEASKTLSGGNQQKIVVAREMSYNSHLLICEQPTRGLDVQSAKYVHENIIKYRDQGKAVLLSSTDLNEIISLSDRIIVMFKGKIMGEFTGDEVDEYEIGLNMAGVRSKNEKN